METEREVRLGALLFWSPARRLMPLEEPRPLWTCHLIVCWISLTRPVAYGIRLMAQGG